MTRLVSDPHTFAREALEGFVAANPEHVTAVRGGVVRASRRPEGQVAIVMGGGSGHFPAFAGWVGPGFGHGAACGGIFASPSEAQVLGVARAADNDRGVLFVPINYAGDILHFTAAVEALRRDGVDARLVAVTDDIASGSTDERVMRRGIAGSFAVLKIAGAAAEEGRTLDEVERVAVVANERTRSFGVAFSGCTLPGADAPFFAVPPGRMAVGLGIHGEPGLSEVDLGTADAVADALVDGLFHERPPEPGRRVAVLVNGLGSTKYDELFLVFSRVRRRLVDAGMELVAPVVGEFVTSLDMAGVSLSLTYLDDESERLWRAPAHTPAFTRGTPSPTASAPLAPAAVPDAPAPTPLPEATSQSRELAARIVRHGEHIVAVLSTEERRLGAIDAVAGDGDHGAGMLRGATAALAAARSAVDAGAGAGTALGAAASAWSDEGGGTSGALWGAALNAAGEALGDDEGADAGPVGRAVDAFARAVAQRGGAAVGDKTMLDAIAPFTDTLRERIAEGGSLGQAWRDAASAAHRAAEETARLAARRGRSRLHGDRSIGTPDAGAVSFAMVVSAVGTHEGE